MWHLVKPSNLLSEILSLFLGLLGTPVAAHTVKSAEDVAVTFHLEPNHNPKAGEPAQTWFVLTQPGGQVIPLDQCECQLNIYDQQQPEGAGPVLQPPLKAVSAEQFQGIPGAEIVFPEPSIYQLEIQGVPKAKTQFQPFRLRFSVTVATGAVRSKPPGAPNRATEDRAQPSISIGPKIGGAILLILGLGLVGLRINRRTKKIR